MKFFTKDMISGILFLITGIFILLALPFQVSDGTSELEVGPRYVPQIMAIIMVVLSSIIIIIQLLKDIREPKRMDKTSGEAMASVVPSKEAIGVLLLIFLWSRAQYYLGYLPVTCLFVILALLLFRVKKKMDYLIAFIFVFLLYVIFQYFLNVRLP